MGIKMNKEEYKNNPVIYSDFPDPDIIRVNDTYYMVSTTMHFMPGCDILRSYDLMNWEFVCHAYDVLEDTPGERLEGKKNVYGQGMWAPSIRYHKGHFFITFTANDTKKTYLLTSDKPQGPWKKSNIEGFYHDNSLFFDEDDRVYIVYGNKTLHLTELKSDLTGPKPNGLDRIVAVDEDNIYLGYEGSHLYRYQDRYYLFSCHMLAYGSCRKSQICFVSDSLAGEFTGKCIIDDDMGFYNLGVAQGGMVDTPQGDWYAFMFQDRGAIGRSPIIVPMKFTDGFPEVGEKGKVFKQVSVDGTRQGHIYEPLNGSDDFLYEGTENASKLKVFWQFNHMPVNELWSVTEKKGVFRLHSAKKCMNMMQAYNTLTQRTVGPKCNAYVTVDAGSIKENDFAGISAFQGCYGAVALTKKEDQYYLVMIGKPEKDETIYADRDYDSPAVEYARIPIQSSKATLKVEVDFTDKVDEARFFYRNGNEWIQIGITKKLYFKMDHFTGCRFGLFYYSTEVIGGWADFMEFRYQSEHNI